jgi:hypothetical protein
MSGLSIGPYPLRLGSIWHYAAPSGGVSVSNTATIVPPAGPGRRNFLSSIQVTANGEQLIEYRIKSGSVVLFRNFGFLQGFPIGFTFSTPLQAGENEALVLEVEGLDGAVYLNAQGYVA